MLVLHSSMSGLSLSFVVFCFDGFRKELSSSAVRWKHKLQSASCVLLRLVQRWRHLPRCLTVYTCIFSLAFLTSSLSFFCSSSAHFKCIFNLDKSFLKELTVTRMSCFKSFLKFPLFSVMHTNVSKAYSIR